MKKTLAKYLGAGLLLVLVLSLVWWFSGESHSTLEKATSAGVFPTNGELTDSICRLSVRNGLAGSTVTSILRDAKDRMWIGTNNGITMYTGKKIMTFHPGKDGEHNFVYNLYASGDRIYATTQQGIFMFDPDRRDFSQVAAEIATAECLLPYDGKLYIGNEDGLIIWMDGIERTIKVSGDIQSQANSVRGISLGRHGIVWFVSKQALNAYDPKTGKVRAIDLEALSRKMTAGEPSSVCTDLSTMLLAGERCYLGTKGNGLFCYDLRTRRLRQVSGIGGVIHSLQQDRRGEVCVATDGTGAYVIDPHTNMVKEHFCTNEKGIHRSPTNAIYCFYRDSTDINWMGYFRYGLSYNYYVEPLFRRYPFPDPSMRNLFVRCSDEHGLYLVLGTPEGFCLYNKGTHETQFFGSDRLSGGHQIIGVKWFDGAFYIGVRDGGLWRLDPAAGALQPILTHSGQQLMYISCLAVSPQSSLYVGTWDGLYVIGPGGQQTMYDSDNSKIGNGIVNSITFDERGNAWLGTSRGLVIRQAGNGLFVNDQFPSGFFNKETHLFGVRGHDGRLFFCNDNGVFYTDGEMRDFGKLTLPEVLNYEVIQAFLDDRRGHYWIGTDRGLFYLGYDGKTLQYYGDGEGLNCQLISRGGLRNVGDSLLQVMTSNGLLEARLQTLMAWPRKAHTKIRLYGIQKGDDQLSEWEEEADNESHKIHLSWNFSSEPLTFKLQSSDFSNYEGRFYEYSLDEGESWTAVRNEEPVRITRLMLGRHRLSVRPLGVSGDEQVYTIYVLPSGWAVAEGIICLIAVISLVLWYRYHKTTRQLLGERDMMEAAIMESEQQEIDREKGAPVKAVRINPDECEAIVRRMRRYLDEHKVYENADLKMSDLAEVLGVSPNKLSQVFNVYLKSSYYDFINECRLAEFKRRVEAGDDKRLTLVALSEQCGFRKSSFFATFRRIEGMTPTEYIKKLR